MPHRHLRGIVFTVVGIVAAVSPPTLRGAQGAAATALKDPRAVAAASASLRALTGGAAITDVKVLASAISYAGSEQQSGLPAQAGTATLEARVGYAAKVALALSAGQRVEVWNGSGAVPQRQWSDSDGVPHGAALHRCWLDPTWFFPALTLETALSNPLVALAYVGQETKTGVAVQHIQIWRFVPGQSPTTTALIQRLSQEDIYLDAASYLPVAIDFNEHTEKDARRSFPVEVEFAGWHGANGITLPARIRKFLQGSLVLDLSVVSAATNSGIPPTEFALR